MQADLYMLKNDPDKVAQIRHSIAKHIDPSIEVVVHDLLYGETPSVQEMLLRYTQQLHAAMPLGPTTGFRTRVLDWQGTERLYFSMYWPVSGHGYTASIDNTTVYFESYSFTQTVSMYPDRGLDRFFPALAIYKRLALVPDRLQYFLRQLGSPMWQSDASVAEVDFDDGAALDERIQQVGQTLMRDIGRDALAHRSRHGATDAAKLAELLEVTPALVEHALRDRANDVAARYHRLRCVLGTTEFPVGVSTKTTLWIADDNDRLGDELAEAGRRVESWDSLLVTIQASAGGPVTILPDTRFEIQRKQYASYAYQEEIAIAVAGVGDFPLEISVMRREDEEIVDRLPRQRIWIKGVPAQS